MDKSTTQDGKAKKKINIRTSAVVKKRVDMKWVVIIVFVSFVMSIFFSFSSTKLISSVRLWVAFLILFFIILIGVFFDVIGIAVAASEETPFHSLAARKVFATKEAIWLIRNAEKVSNFCNDVIGDIAGIVSGAAGAIIVQIILSKYNMRTIYLGLALTGLITALTVGGKAVGKSIAISKCNNIVYITALVIYYAKKVFTLRKSSKEEV